MNWLACPNSAGILQTSYIYHGQVGLPHSTWASPGPFVFHLKQENPSQDTVSIVAWLVS